MSTPSELDFNNLQGDILLGGLPKKTQTFFFFQIDKNRVSEFRKQLAKFVPEITTTTNVVKNREDIDRNKAEAQKSNTKPSLLEISGINISFTKKGLTQLGIKDDIGDGPFNAGMLDGAQALGDPGKTDPNTKTFSPNWDDAFKKEIHGVILITGQEQPTVDEQFKKVKDTFLLGTANATIIPVKTVVGIVREKDKGHEHFGFLDGVSQPAVQGVDKKTNRGQETIRQGIVLLGRDGDNVQRPSWALDGSFLSFRYLSQLVPEFNRFLEANPVPGLPPKQGSELLGARLVGRWKSGAPIDLTPDVDDPVLGADKTRNDDFSFNSVFPDDQTTQDRCPFAAHIRKTNPRADLKDFGGTEVHRIIRSGIPFGPELSDDEKSKKKTIQDRGLLFVAYQSNISNGFQFIQQAWANNPDFPPNKGVQSGFDAIIGQHPDPKAAFNIAGTDPNNPNSPPLKLTQWALPKGGEYFFSPSIKALKETFALK